MPEVKSTFSIIKNLFKVIVLAAVAGGAIFGNFMLEKRIEAESVTGSVNLTVFDYKKENILADHGVIRFADAEEYAGEPSMEVVAVKDHEYILKLNKGKFWGNFGVSNSKVNILVGDNVVMIPDGATFVAEFDGSYLKVMTLGGDLYFGFLESGVKLEQYTNKYSAVFMNRFVVPRDSQAVISLSKIDQRLKGLLYSRLYTEFKRSTITADSKNAKFVIDNKSKDDSYLNDLKSEFVEDSRFQGRAVAEGKLADAVFWAEENLTFVPDKKDQMVFNHLFAYLDQAVYYANKDDQAKVDEFWQKFKNYRDSLNESIKFSEEYYKEIDSYIDGLGVFSPGDSQYNLYKELLAKKFDEGRDQLEIAGRVWLDVYEAMDKASGMVKMAVTDYYEYLAALMKADSKFKNNNEEVYQVFVAYQDQLIENLFLRYSGFYQLVYFDIKEVLEKEILSFYEQGQLKTELSQDFISRKIDFLRRLMSLFFDDLVDVQSAKDITDNLVEGIYRLTPPESAKTAVTALFQSQLNNLTDFWGYLDNVEYNGSKAHGLAHKDRYDSYLRERDRVWTFETMTDAVLGGGGTVSAGAVDKIKSEIILNLTDNKDVANLQVAEVDDPNARYIDVKYVLGGYPVKATFDRDGKTLKNVYAYDQLISEAPVKSEDLLKLIDEKLSAQYKLEDTSGTTKDLATSVKNNAERIAKLYLVNKIKTVGFEVTEDQIKLVDEINLIYRVDRIFLKTSEDTFVTLDYLSTQEKVSNLYFELKGTPIVLAGEYTLQEVKDLISNNQVAEKGEVKKTQRGGL